MSVVLQTENFECNIQQLIWIQACQYLPAFSISSWMLYGATVVCPGDNTIWKPDSCQDCRCHSNIATCEPTVCKDPQCDFQKGEVLQIAPNKCCPECASRAEGFCQHEGQIHSHGMQWASSGCVWCSCAHGRVNCTPTACPALTCGRGELQYTEKGSCCPKCVGLGEPCSFDGRLFQDGEDWRLGRCSKCVCRDGAMQCFTASCQPLLCSQDEVMVMSPGKCCPECVPKPCSVSGRVYQHGEQWKKNTCTACACHRGEVRCLRETCDTITCEKGENKVQHPGKCCQECVSSKGNCFYDGTKGRNCSLLSFLSQWQRFFGACLCAKF
uniref:VWFC domain-containing protein n=1 Tax=Strix occidentalis caurina TaxID=311401 RepID=A0A8D0FTF9_STROC